MWTYDQLLSLLGQAELIAANASHCISTCIGQYITVLSVNIILVCLAALQATRAFGSHSHVFDVFDQ
jgi:hypothetical protein